VAKKRRATVSQPATDADVVVIGAGPAGSLAARLLAREGLGVMLVERRAFPRPKVCGGCLNAQAVAVLERAGLAERVRALGASRVNRLRLHHHGRRAEIGLPEGLAVSRASLDEALAGAAAEAGCDVRFETAAVVDPRCDEAAGLAIRVVCLGGKAGREDIVRARAVVVADGLGHSSLRGCPGFESDVDAASRVGIGADVPPGAVPVTRGTISMAVSRDGYAGAVEVEFGRVNIAAAVDPAFLKASGSPAEALRAIFADAGVPVEAPFGSIDWMGTMPLTRRLSDPAARGIFVIGDAAGYVEPFTGEGMAWALTGAWSVAPLVAQTVRSPGAGAEQEWVQHRARIIGRDQRRCRLLASGLRRPALVAASLALVSRYPRATAPVIAHFSPRPPAATERTV
jgi:menaquinone-9 beta-reductase